MATESVLDGVFAINKPYGMSSAQVIRDCKTYFNPSVLFQPMLAQMRADRAKEDRYQQRRRRKVKQAIEVKMGHGGTLDPMATGVLILGVGKGTKALQGFLGCTKTYETVVVFGASSDSYDRCGHLLKKRPYDHITREKVEEALDSFRGTYQQMPPLFSALKMEGKPLYEYAREGKPIPREIQTREVTVTDVEILEWYEPGTHEHHWPTQEATAAEKQYAEQLWRVEKQQVEGKKMTEEEEEADTQAIAEHNDLKRKFEERQDELVVERQSKKNRNKQQNQQANGEATSPVMSGALGELPPKGKGSDLVPPVTPGTPPPWKDKGPPAVRIRMTGTSGFYVRSFAHDLGEKVGSAGLMAELVRNRQGDFVLGTENCLEYDDLAKGEDVWSPKLKDMLRRWNQPGGIKGGEKEAQQKVGEEEEAAAAKKGKSRAESPQRSTSPKAESTSKQAEEEAGTETTSQAASPKADSSSKTEPDAALPA
ncbi:pseudouridine synthase [Cryphonectria parasitica EP155]|uniref:tRNA pseudouridine(55) synthase n=1 Tax=Cryphonectria parasitica (strain ATCC 38755 / EP155) TaxID=660469 RepID=A0A9P4YDA5_CRYP1|nr:pseudouridine synthase [Cryphonectria parasitica EP155]KAF3771271.1 pseudouridine synthase [Cryphonectria parasitica EP155]